MDKLCFVFVVVVKFDVLLCGYLNVECVLCGYVYCMMFMCFGGMFVFVVLLFVYQVVFDLWVDGLFVFWFELLVFVVYYYVFDMGMMLYYVYVDEGVGLYLFYELMGELVD